MLSVVVRFHNDLHIVIERDEEAKKTFHPKLTEVAAQHLRDVWLADA